MTTEKKKKGLLARLLESPPKKTTGWCYEIFSNGDEVCEWLDENESKIDLKTVRITSPSCFVDCVFFKYLPEWGIKK